VVQKKKKRPNAGEVSGGACTYEDFAKGVISAYGPRRGDKFQGAPFVADTGKKTSLETQMALPRSIGRFD